MTFVLLIVGGVCLGLPLIAGLYELAKRTRRGRQLGQLFIEVMFR